MADVSDTASLLANEYTGIRGHSMEIPYWINRRLEITIDRLERRDYKRTIMITPLFRDKLFMERWDDYNWYFRRWWFIDLPF